jgi:hypothetical protein
MCYLKFWNSYVLRVLILHTYLDGTNTYVLHINLKKLRTSSTLGTRIDQMSDLMTILEPIWSSNLVKNAIWSTHLVTQQYPPFWSSNLVKLNLVRIDHTGSDNGQSGQFNLAHQTHMVKPIWSTRPSWSIHLCQPDQSGQST